MPVLDRLVGLETEYAIRFRPADPVDERPTNFQLYNALIRSLRQRVLCVDASHIKDGVFLATGGAVWFERVRYAGGWGLIEGTTPECRGPRQLLLYQRAQDRLLSEVARESSPAGEFTLIKNDRDSRDNVYGAQENYEVTLAGSWRLLLWRIGLVLLLPLMVLAWLGLLLQILLFVVYVASAFLLYVCIRPLLGDSGRYRAVKLLFGSELADGVETGSSLPQWLESLNLWFTRLAVAPLALALVGLAWLCAFVPIRRQLTPLLISRAVVGGSGALERDGSFLMADKAHAINCLVGFCGLIDDRPLFSYGHFFKTLCFQVWLRPGDFLELFAARQRLQICLGDSNMAEEAEYLRIGTTLMVLDLIEAGRLTRAPRFRRPLRAMRRLCSDPTLAATVRDTSGRDWTAVALQRFYLDACRDFFAGHPSEEASDLLRRWEGVLDLLEGDQQQLVGRVDWVTKRFLLQQSGGGSDWDARKKIDLRYHELSPEGYFQRLRTTGLPVALVEEQDLERAMRTPPAGTPATTRGHFIREFAHGLDRLKVNWNTIVIGRGLRTKIIRLARFGGRGSQPQ